MIANLPQELIERVAIHLDAAGLSALRLVSRASCTKVFQSWVKCLHTIRIDVGAQSLQRLLAIGQVASMRDHVRGLHIQNDGNHSYGQGLEWSRDATGSLLVSNPNGQFRLLQTCLCDHLKNCRSFYIKGWGDEGQYRAPGTLGVSEVAILFLNIVAENGLAMQSFSLDIDQNLNPSRFEPYLVLCQQPQFSQGWSSLQELRIHEDIRLNNVIWIRDMIQKAPNLRRLSLSFTSRTESSINQRILSLMLPPLEEVSLQGNQLTAQTLLEFLSPTQRSLQRLSLRLTRLEDGGRDDQGRCRDWKYLFRSLRADFPHLRCISLYYPYGPPRPGCIPLSFRMNCPALAEHDGRLCEELPNEKFELQMRIKTWHLLRPGLILWVYGIVYEGRYMTRALERLEETMDYV